jgi:hypothetical protein
MLAELPAYLASVDLIPSLEARKDADGNDTFSRKCWWQEAAVLPSYIKILAIVLCNTPNSCPPERVFSMVTRTWGSQRRSTRADMIELSTQLQFNRHL